QKLSPIGLVLSVLLLVLPLVPGMGDRAGGATRWVNLGILRFQPGEFVKLSFVVFLAGYFFRHEEKIPGFLWGMFKPLFFAAIVALLYLLQPDFGSAAVLMVVTLAMALAAGVRLRYIMICGVLSLFALGALIFISPYRMARVTSFLSPWEDPSGKGYQLIQSLIAVGSGQWTGVGLGSSQQKLFFLPAAHTDFIFSVIGEELGFVGSTVLILAFLYFLYRGLKLAGSVAGDTFSYTLAVGLTSLIALPALLNVGVAIGVLPTKGMVLPLVGYGGSSLLVCLMAVGILLAIWRDNLRGLR
ncbi:MAG: putative lipid II flippase FtsW, partial [SAR324 cluster bacterium]|nr:putative lipid II flippase FtsW [SAR324 cluster bacterium]